LPRTVFDLAVVGHEPERLGQRPHRVGVGGVALVEDGQRDVDRLGEIREQPCQAVTRDETLVDHGSRGGGRHREAPVRRRAAGPGPAAGAGQRQLELGVGQRGRPPDERLEHPGQRGARLTPERRGIDGDRAPVGRRQPLGGEGALDDDARPAVVAGAGAGPRPRLGTRREHREHPRQLPGEPAGIDDPEQRRREGEEHPRAVARCPVGRERPPVAQRGQAAQRQRENPAAGPPPGVGDEPDAAGVVLVPGVVERRRLPRVRRGRRDRAIGAALWTAGGGSGHRVSLPGQTW
jgi:hypothetical protein